MCEEVRSPSTQVPRAMVGTIVLNTIAGLVILITLVFVLPDLQDMIQYDEPVPKIIKSAVGSPGAAIGLLIPLCILALMCGIGCTTAASRATWAFSRDGAIPGSRIWQRINKALSIPFNAMMLNMAVQIVLGAIYFGSATAFNSFSSAGTIFLTLSYTTPITVSLFTGRRHVKQGDFYLGLLGSCCNIVAICGSSLVCPFGIPH